MRNGLKLFQNLLHQKPDTVRQCTFKNVGLNLHLKLFNFEQGSLGGTGQIKRTGVLVQGIMS